MENDFKRILYFYNKYFFVMTFIIGVCVCLYYFYLFLNRNNGESQNEKWIEESI